jgi:hypothetical protein
MLAVEREENSMEKTHDAKRTLLPILVIGGLAVGLGAGLWLGGRAGSGAGGEEPGAGARAGNAAPIVARPAEAAKPVEPTGGEARPADTGAPLVALPVLEPSPPPRLENATGPVELPPPPAAQPLALTPPLPAPSPGAGTDRGEGYWRERTAAARDRLVATYEGCLAHASAPYRYVMGEGRTLQIIDASAFADAKAAFLSAQSSLRFLRDEARRASVPPGWVRVDWNSYPRTPSPEDGVCERTLPEEVQPR